jgi:glycosyltransferase involved in cell wall biosynthesis
VIKLQHRPLISVSIPSYNVGQYIEKALQSVLSQTYDHLEIIVVNDGSTDNTAEKVQQFTDPRIRLISHPQNRGLSAAHNTAIDHARGEFYAVLDPDDLSLPDRLECQVNHMLKYPKLGVLGGGVTLFGEVHQTIDTPSILPPMDHDHFFAQLILNAAFNHPTLMFRKSVLEQVRDPEAGFYYDPEFKSAPDYNLMVRVMKKSLGENLPKVLTLWQKRQKSNSKHPLNRTLSLKVQQSLLEEMGYPLTEAELNLHQKIAFFMDEELLSSPDSAFFQSVNQWFRQLSKVNRQSRYFKPHALENVLWMRWVLLCKTFKSPQWQYHAFLKPPCRFHVDQPSSWQYLSTKIRGRKEILKPEYIQKYQLPLTPVH